MEIYFLDRTFSALGVASTEHPKMQRFWDDLESDELDTAGKSFTLTTDWNNDIKNQTYVGNFVVFQDEEGKDQWYTIITRDIDVGHHSCDIYCESSGLDLLNEIEGAVEAPSSAQPLTYYVADVIYDTGWEIGLNEVSSYTRTLSWEGEATSSERLLSIANSFDCEVEFRVEISGMKVQHRYVDFVQTRGESNTAQLYLNKEVDNIEIHESIADLITAVKPQSTYTDDGGTEVNIDLDGYSLTTSQAENGRFVMRGGTICDTVNGAIWTRYVAEGGTDEGYIVGSYTSEAHSQSSLATHAITYLKKHCTPAVTYEVTVSKLPKNLHTGDTVYVISNEDGIYLNQRVYKIERSRANGTIVLTLEEGA